MTTASKIIMLDSVDSTNNYAMGMIRDGVAKHGNAWFTYEQTAGKGRRGKGWNAEKGKNILMSIAVSTGFLTLYQQFHLSVAVSLGCLDLFTRFAGDETSIKWPNDIFWNDRKAGGILIENVIKGNSWQWAVIGTGININQTHFDSDTVFTPVSLKQITGKEYDVAQLANELYQAIMKRYEALQGKGFEAMLNEYNQNLFCRGKKIKLKKNNVVFETIIKGVSHDGKLITSDPVERAFDFDKVEWVK